MSSESAAAKIMGKLIFLIAVLGCLFAIPQIWKIYVGRNASGVSALSWFSWVGLYVFWLAYGILRHDKAIIFNNIIWIVFGLLIAVGALIYG